jgi:hypothetical protein
MHPTDCHLAKMRTHLFVPFEIPASNLIAAIEQVQASDFLDQTPAFEPLCNVESTGLDLHVSRHGSLSKSEAITAASSACVQIFLLTQ